MKLASHSFHSSFFLIIGLSEQLMGFFCVKPEFIHNDCFLLIMRGRVLDFVFYNSFLQQAVTVSLFVPY